METAGATSQASSPSSTTSKHSSVSSQHRILIPKTTDCEQGVDTIWISPVYDSPQIDMGYDISNYEAIYPPYGTMDDMDKLIAEAKQRGLRLLMDLVINHTSDQHAWFKESASSRDNPKRDWYIWHDGVIENGKRRAPNNWRANFSTPACK